MKENANQNQNADTTRREQGGQANRPNQSSNVGTGSSRQDSSQTSRDSDINRGQSGSQQQRTNK